MRTSLLLLPLGVALLIIGAPASSAMPKPAKPALVTLTAPVVCQGNRRNYSGFNHCWRLNRSIRYCARICHE